MTRISLFFTDAARFLVDPGNKKHAYPEIAWTVTVILGTFTMGIPQLLSEVWRYFQPEEINETHESIKKIFRSIFCIKKTTEETLSKKTFQETNASPSIVPQTFIPQRKEKTILPQEGKKTKIPLKPETLDIPPPPLKPEKTKISFLVDEILQIFANVEAHNNAFSLGKALQEPLEKAILNYLLTTLSDPKTNVQEILKTALDTIDAESKLKKNKRKGGGSQIRHWIEVSEKTLLKSLSQKYIDNALHPIIEDFLKEEESSEKKAFAQLAQLITLLKKSYPEDYQVKILPLFKEPINIYAMNVQKDLKDLPSDPQRAAEILSNTQETWEKLLLMILCDVELVRSSKNLLEKITQEINDQLANSITKMHNDFAKKKDGGTNSVYAWLNTYLLILNIHHKELDLPNPLEQLGTVINTWRIRENIFEEIVSLKALNPSKRAIAEALNTLNRWIKEWKRPGEAKLAIKNFLDCLDTAMVSIEKFNLLQLEDRDVLLACYMVNLRSTILSAAKIIRPVYENIHLNHENQEDRALSLLIQKIDKKLETQLNMGLQLQIKMNIEGDGLFSILLFLYGEEHSAAIREWVEAHNHAGDQRTQEFEKWIIQKIATRQLNPENEPFQLEQLYQNFLRENPLAG